MKGEMQLAGRDISSEISIDCDENTLVDYCNLLTLDASTIRRLALSHIKRRASMKGYFIGYHLSDPHLFIIYWFHNAKMNETIVSKYNFIRLKNIRKLLDFSGFAEYSEINLAKQPIFI